MGSRIGLASFDALSTECLDLTCRLCLLEGKGWARCPCWLAGCMPRRLHPKAAQWVFMSHTTRNVRAPSCSAVLPVRVCGSPAPGCAIAVMHVTRAWYGTRAASCTCRGLCRCLISQNLRIQTQMSGDLPARPRVKKPEGWMPRPWARASTLASQRQPCMRYH